MAILFIMGATKKKSVLDKKLPKWLGGKRAANWRMHGVKPCGLQQRWVLNLKVLGSRGPMQWQY